MKYKSLCRLFIVLTLLLWPIGTFAENIDPNDDGSQYAYGENVGWFNAEPLGDGGPGVRVNDTKLTGYIWAENIGWVSLSCENTASCATVNYGVTNDGMGNLAGYAWAENAGWISFSCENTGSCGTVSYGVTIDPATGEFSGRAWGENIGWITFRSTGPVAFRVTTAWLGVPVVDDISFDACISELCTSAFSVSAYDPAGGDLTYTWEALDGGAIIGEGADVVFDPPTIEPGYPCPYLVKLTVTSSVSGLSTEQTIGIYVKLAGDADGDGVVNVLDKVLVRNHFGENPASPTWDPRADVDCNGVVNVLDKVTVRNQFGQTGCACP